MPFGQQAAVIRPAQVRHLIRVTEATSRHWKRDHVVLLLGHTCGMRVTETARVCVRDVMLPSGALREEVSLRAEITKGLKQRCVYLTNQMAREAIDRYVEHRWETNQGVELDRGRFRGISPDTALVLTHKGSAFELTRKKRVGADGAEQEYVACDSLQAHVSKLYRDAGLGECSSHSGRRTLATNLVRRGESIETVKRILGHSELDHTDPYLEVSVQKLRQMFVTVI